MMKKLGIALVVLALVAAAGYWIYRVRYQASPPTVMTAEVTRGDIVDAVGASGTLEAVTTVQVGTQVSGTIQQLYADFNSIVRKGQVIARLDPSLFTTQIDQARANLVRAEADVERLRVALEDSRSKLVRAENLAQQELIPAQDLEAAQLTVRSSEAQLRSSLAQVTQARATLNQNQVNLQHTVIEAPIDGIVISRNVDVGQTVAASMQAPTLFILAADLTKMKVNASIDEADVGRIRPGQVVRFRVDAYPDRDFTGAVSQVRLQPVVTSNVVTYATVIDVPNPELLLKPGMTANVNIEIARREDVLRVPNAALRFRPTAETFVALGLPVPEDLDRPRGNRGTAQGAAAPGRVEMSTPATDAVRARYVEPQQAQQPARPRGEGRRPGAAAGAPQKGAPAPRAASPQPAAPEATTFDGLFGPLPATETSGRAWVYGDGQLRAVRLRLGITDGTHTELLAGEVNEGTTLVTNVAIAQVSANNASRSPLMGPQRGRPGARNTGTAGR